MIESANNAKQSGLKLTQNFAITLRNSAEAAAQFAAGEAGPNTSMNESPDLNGQKAVGVQLQGNALAKAKAAGKPTIYTPDYPPPPINKTLVSYDGPKMGKMAKSGDLDAINALILICVQLTEMKLHCQTSSS